MKKNLVIKLTMAAAMTGMLAGCGTSNTTTETVTQAQATTAAEVTEAEITVEETTVEETTGEDMLAEIQEAGVIVVGTEGTYSPNSYHDESGKLVGFDVEVAEKVARELGVQVEFVESKWDSLFAGMDSGRIDTVINEVEASDERREKYDFSNPYTYIHGALLVAADNEDIQSVEDLEGKRAAQNLTSSWGALAESYGAELVAVDSMNQSVELMLTGRADVTLNAETAFYDFMKNRPDQAVKIAAMTDSTTSSSIPVPKGNEALVEAINEALANLQESGELEELSVKYFGADVTRE